MAIWKIDELGEFVTLKRGYDLPQQKRKNGELRQNKANERLSTMASFYKSMALKKVGSRIRIPKRQYMGESATFMKQLDTWIASEIDKRFSNI